ncbi:MAG: hypothetical protein ACXV0U_05080 [Kineosporiaceae bacterium]
MDLEIEHPLSNAALAEHDDAPLTTAPPTLAATIAVNSVRQELVGARVGDPAIPEAADRRRAPARTRVRAAAVLRSAADRLAPARPHLAH